MIQIKKEDNWDVPEGIHPAFLKEMRVIEKMQNGKVEKFVRPIFHITSLRSPRYNYVVAKNYPLSEPHKLQADLTYWLGDRIYDLADADGKISLEALDSLVGTEADLHVIHLHNDNHKAPFCHLLQIAPAGLLVPQN